MFILFSSLLSFLYSAGELSVKNKSARNYLLAAFFLILSLQLLDNWEMTNGQFKGYPYLFGWSVILVFWTGPILYRYVLLQTGESYPFGPRFYFEMIPGFIFLLFISATSIYSQSSSRTFITHENMMQKGTWVFLLGILHLSIYILLSSRGLLRILTRGNLKTELTPWICFGIMGSAFSVLALAVYIYLISQSMDLLAYLFYPVAVILPFLYPLRLRYPNFFQDLDLLIKKEKYRVTQLANVNIQLVKKRLKVLMEEEHVYRDESLTLKSLAGMTELSHHQLSEYFNNILKTNFAGFVNHYRIEEARQLLRDKEQDLSMIQTAFQVGFNSKSAFNYAFSRHEGQSPTQYKKNH